MSDHIESDRMPKILDAMDEEHRHWVELIAGIGEFEATRRQRERWSAVDTWNHVTAWKENSLTVARLQSEPGAAYPDPALGTYGILGLGPDIDTVNAGYLATWADWSLERTQAWAEEIHGSLVAALRALPTDRVLVPNGPHGIVGWVLLPAIEHPPEHRLRLERQLGYTP